MAYKQFVPLTNMNFEFNRVSTYGDDACREEELWEIAARLTEFNPAAWYREWNNIAVRAESEGRYMHASFYHRMSEFFLPPTAPEKHVSYKEFRRCFDEAVKDDDLRRFEIPYPGGSLPAYRIEAPAEKGVILLHGGFDSFIEEFYLEVRKMAARGYTFIVFEGPGQGMTLRKGMKMTHEWEKPVSAVLDYFNLQQAALVGVSLGGYLALRAAAFEPRIKQVVAYDIVYDAFACFTDRFPEPFRSAFREKVFAGKKDEINRIAEELRQKDDLVDWGLTHGMYVIGSETPFDYFRSWTNYSAENISADIRQDILLLAGEHDHFIPLAMYQRQKDALINARSARGRIFTTEEGGDQHCQVGNLDLAWNEIVGWLDGFYA